jgi:uracil-DNA glycosylase family 4
LHPRKFSFAGSVPHLTLPLIRRAGPKRFILTHSAMPAKPKEPPGFPAEIPSPASLDELHGVMVRCTRCDLSLSRTQVVPGAGDARASLLFVGEAPGANEDREGVPFVGASGRLLDAMLEEAGIERDQVFIANVVRCRPPKNRNPRAREIRACAGWLAEQIRLVQPGLVATLGRFALQHFIPGGKITQLQATLQQIDYGGREVRVFPLLHPSAVLRTPDLRPRYQEQFQQLAATLGKG